MFGNTKNKKEEFKMMDDDDQENLLNKQA